MEQNTTTPKNPRTPGTIAALVSEAREQLLTFASTPIRLREIDTRMQTLEDIDARLELDDEERAVLDGSLLCAYIEVLGLRLDEQRRTREAHTAESVIADAWSEARAHMRELTPDHPLEETEVLVVLRGEPDWDVTEILLPLMTVAPLVGPASRRRWRYSLLRCPEWFYHLLRSKVDGVTFGDGVPVLGSPVELLGDQDAEVIIALWDESPSSIYFDLTEAASAARALA